MFKLDENSRHVSIFAPKILSDNAKEVKLPTSLFGTKKVSLNLRKNLKNTAKVQSKSIGKRGSRKMFIFGNYDKYYNYRNSREKWEDARLSVLKRSWFKNKKCLDIGCNAGIFTIQIASLFRCAHILGVDIDQNLVMRARANVIEMERKQKTDVALKLNKNRKFLLPSAAMKALPTEEKTSIVSEESLVSSTMQSSSDSSFLLPKLIKNISSTADTASTESKSLEKRQKFPKNISFTHGDILGLDLKASDTCSPPFDVVLVYLSRNGYILTGLIKG
eukprot:CAMPEP_0167742568 /NCGR_PEP_ID=MMETSP0110_2-20121227/1508_1 /TAXON_ID=629695 /ORGANISM="Gymnochlora sp., Strain CCMP2014" /LENGTH=275 /DNA_ID=CAMNT_0007626793 /DNA_START=273 /DNA_END=1101 /DNA_ORIENTATION=-